MGEYWKPVNLDKQQQVHPHRVNDGLKWREWVSDNEGDPQSEPLDSHTRAEVARLIAIGVWSDRDEVRIVSDYDGSVHWLGEQTDRDAKYDDDWQDANGLRHSREASADPGGLPTQHEDGV